MNKYKENFYVSYHGVFDYGLWVTAENEEEAVKIADKHLDDEFGFDMELDVTSVEVS